MRMSLEQVKIACLHYDHTMPLFEGAVKIAGVDAAFETPTAKVRSPGAPNSARK
jgi:hypothetical protein